MKTVAIGDIHGRDIWKDIVEGTNFDHVVFVGDYFDAKGRIAISSDEQVQNFKNILAYKNENKQKVTLLLGNHDFRYLSSIDDKFYGYQPGLHVAVQGLLDDSVFDGTMQVATEIDDILFTHAGVSISWCNENSIDMDALSASINSKFLRNPDILSFVHTHRHRLDRLSPRQSPIWIRPQGLLPDKVEIPQVVGHTVKKGIEIKNDIAFIDTLGNSGEYLFIDNGEFQIQGRNFLSKEEKNEILDLFTARRDDLYMGYNDTFEYVGCTNGNKPEQSMLFLREGEVFGAIGDKELLMPYGGTIMEIYNKEEANKVGYHFKLVRDL